MEKVKHELAIKQRIFLMNLLYGFTETFLNFLYTRDDNITLTYFMVRK